MFRPEKSAASNRRWRASAIARNTVASLNNLEQRNLPRGYDISNGCGMTPSAAVAFPSLAGRRAPGARLMTTIPAGRCG
jgi:hypothetical protein